jgi:hypothetical protein
LNVKFELQLGVRFLKFLGFSAQFIAFLYGLCTAGLKLTVCFGFGRDFSLKRRQLFVELSDLGVLFVLYGSEKRDFLIAFE